MQEMSEYTPETRWIWARESAMINIKRYLCLTVIIYYEMKKKLMCALQKINQNSSDSK